MMAVDEMGDVYYALPFSHAIGGTGPLYPQGIYISGIEAPTGLAFDSDGNLIFSDFQRNTVSRYSFADQSRTVITSDLRVWRSTRWERFTLRIAEINESLTFRK